MRTTSDFFDQPFEPIDKLDETFVPRLTVPLYPEKISTPKPATLSPNIQAPFFAKPIPSQPQAAPSALEQIQLAIQKEVADLKQHQPTLDQLIQNALNQKLESDHRTQPAMPAGRQAKITVPAKKPAAPVSITQKVIKSITPPIRRVKIRPPVQAAPELAGLAPFSIDSRPRVEPLAKISPVTTRTPSDAAKPFQQPAKDLWWPDQSAPARNKKILKVAAEEVSPPPPIPIRLNKAPAPIPLMERRIPFKPPPQASANLNPKQIATSAFHISTNLASYFLFFINQESDPYRDGNRQKVIYGIKLGAYLVVLAGVFEATRILGAGLNVNGLLEIVSIFLIAAIFFFFGENLNILFQPHNPYQIHEVV